MNVIKMLLILLASAFFMQSVLAQNEKITPAQQRDIDKLFTVCWQQLNTDTGLSLDNLNRLKIWINRSPQAKMIYIQHLRLFEKDYLNALYMASSEILHEKMLTNLKKNQQSAYQKALSTWQKEKDQAFLRRREIPEKPIMQMLYIAYPDSANWTILPQNLEYVNEIALALASLKCFETATAICDFLSQREGLERLKAFEIFADIRAQEGRYKEALACLGAGEAYAKTYQANYRNTDKVVFNRQLKAYRAKRDQINRLAHIPRNMKWYIPDISSDGLFLLDIAQKIDNNTLTIPELEMLRKKTLESESHRERCLATVLLARISRVADEDPLTSIRLLIPLLVEKKCATDFLQMDRKNLEESLRQYKLNKGKIFIQHPSRVLQTPLPPIHTWLIKPENGCAIPELANTLLELGKSGEAAEIFVALRDSVYALDSLESLYVATLIALKNDDLKKAEELCKQGFEQIPHLFTTSTGRRQRDRGGEIQMIQTKYEQLLKRITYERDVKRLGAGFVLYREAEIYRQTGNFLQAYLTYQQMSKVDSGIYLMASGAYTVKCLLHFATESGITEIQKVVKEREFILTQKNEMLKQVQKSKPLAKFSKKLTKSIAENQRVINQIKSIPTGERALIRAVALMEKLIAQNEYGVYRGEMLVDIARFYTTELCHLKFAESYFKRADVWMEKIRRVDATFDALLITGDVAALTAPPTTARYKDTWGNTKHAELRPGMLFNRQTSNWYLTELQKETSLYLGFFSFMRGENEVAKMHWDRVGEFDPELKKISSNVYSRLRFLQSINRKAFLTPDESVKFFKGNMKLALFLADFNYQCENWKTAERFYLQIYNQKFGKLNKEQLAAVISGLAQTQVWLKNGISAPDIIEKHVNDIKGSKIESQTLLLCANLFTQVTARSNEKEDQVKIKNAFQRIIDRCPKSSEAEFALYVLGWIHIAEEPKEAMQYFQLYLKKYPNGDYVDLIADDMKKIK